MSLQYGYVHRIPSVSSGLTIIDLVP
jgi:hypothetical protein